MLPSPPLITSFTCFLTSFEQNPLSKTSPEVQLEALSVHSFPANFKTFANLSGNSFQDCCPNLFKDKRKGGGEDKEGKRIGEF